QLKSLLICPFEFYFDSPKTVTLLDDDRSTTALHDQYRLAYAEILYHWGLYEARAELLKFMSFVKTTVGSPLGEQQQPLGNYCTNYANITSTIILPIYVSSKQKLEYIATNAGLKSRQVQSVETVS
ncbi:3050_t:CDS:1, partial [Cetraspora pellucida]